MMITARQPQPQPHHVQSASDPEMRCARCSRSMIARSFQSPQTQFAAENPPQFLFHYLFHGDKKAAIFVRRFSLFPAGEAKLMLSVIIKMKSGESCSRSHPPPPLSCNCCYLPVSTSVKQGKGGRLFCPRSFPILNTFYSIYYGNKKSFFFARST